MKGRYQLKHPEYGNGYKFTELRNALKELARTVGGNWYIYDRQDKRRI